MLRCPPSIVYCSRGSNFAAECRYYLKVKFCGTFPFVGKLTNNKDTQKSRKSLRGALFVALVSTDSIVFVDALPVLDQTICDQKCRYSTARLYCKIMN